MPSLLITRPRYEPVTHYLYYWTINIVAEAHKKGKVFDLEKEKVNKKNSELFRFYTNSESISHPLKDEYAKPFFETSNQVCLSLIKGKTAKEANEDSLRLYRKTVSELLTSRATNSFVVPDLIWNMAHQVCY